MTKLEEEQAILLKAIEESENERIRLALEKRVEEIEKKLKEKQNAIHIQRRRNYN